MSDERYTGWLCRVVPTAPKGTRDRDHQRAVASPDSALAKTMSERHCSGRSGT